MGSGRPSRDDKSALVSRQSTERRDSARYHRSRERHRRHVRERRAGLAVRSTGFSLRTSRSALLVVAALAMTGCNPFRPAFRETITEGEHLGHYVHFAEGFE